METKHNLDPRQQALHEHEKGEAQHVEITRGDSGPSQHKQPGPYGDGERDGSGGYPYGEAQTHDPKWEKATVRKIDVRLLIIREFPNLGTLCASFR